MLATRARQQPVISVDTKNKERIGPTTIKNGLKVESALGTRTCQMGIKVAKAWMKSLDIAGDRFRPEWSYTQAAFVGMVPVIIRCVLSSIRLQ